MNKYFFFIGIILFVCLSFTSCGDDDSFSSSPNDILAFSSDTVYFDTIFTGQSSSDRTFMIYNPNKKALRVQRIYLADVANSGYMMNVDGMSVDYLEDLEIDGKDSIYVRVRANPAVTGNNTPVLIKDSVVFITNGVTQYVRLRAMGQDAWKWTGKVIAEDTILSSERPYVIYDSLKVAAGATLKLQPGTVLHFHKDASLLVDGTLVSEGTLEYPVVFRGDRLDNLFPTLPYDYLSGQWGGVRISGKSYGNYLNHTIIRGGNYGIHADSSEVSQIKLRMDNSTIHNVRGTALYAVNCKMELSNTSLTNAKTACAYLLGGEYSFLHCTIANYYTWENRDGESIVLRNHTVMPDKKLLYYPLYTTSFINSIIYGSRTQEISLLNTYNNEEVDTDFDYSFHACLIRAKEQKDNNRFTQIVWNKDPKYKMINDEYRYDFRPDALSAAIDIADFNYAIELPADADGNDRLEDGKPDAGAFEYIEQE